MIVTIPLSHIILGPVKPLPKNIKLIVVVVEHNGFLMLAKKLSTNINPRSIRVHNIPKTIAQLTGILYRCVLDRVPSSLPNISVRMTVKLTHHILMVTHSLSDKVHVNKELVTKIYQSTSVLIALYLWELTKALVHDMLLLEL
jgi:hypothetical protein